MKVDENARGSGEARKFRMNYLRKHPYDLSRIAVGSEVGAWTILSLTPGPAGGYGTADCRCECGAENVLKVYDLIRGVTKRCGGCITHSRNRSIQAVALTHTPFRLIRGENSKRDNTSTSSQIGKAGEHFACGELILQGQNAFLADAGLPYDIVVDRGKGLFWRVQVKSTTRLYRRIGCGIPVYRFALRKGRGSDRRISLDSVDYCAFVALDTKQVAWLPSRDLIVNGAVKLLMEFKTKRFSYKVGAVEVSPHGKFIEDYSVFYDDSEMASGRCA